ncbi:MAG: nucleoside-diphosphate kinase [Candidatus Melainabacteria bacterium]|nr:nucleoside-diphosphate kinase [Candidatus Melainabacteria bacterium]
MTTQNTFLAIKPDAFKRGDTAGIVKMLVEKLDAKCVAMKVYKPTEELAKEHYAALSEKPFFPDLIQSFTAGLILGMVWQGEDVVAKARDAMGATDPEAADEGTIRKKFGKHIGDNAIHGSDTEPGSAERELKIHFPEADFTEIADPVAKCTELCQAAV